MKKADWFDPEINPKVRSFGEHYGTVFLPTRPYTPRHKGKVERGVDYVQENALRGRSFAALEEQNRFLLDWELTVADTRVHGTTRRHVGKHFAEVELAALLPLPLARISHPYNSECVEAAILRLNEARRSRQVSISVVRWTEVASSRPFARFSVWNRLGQRGPRTRSQRRKALLQSAMSPPLASASQHHRS